MLKEHLFRFIGLVARTVQLCSVLLHIVVQKYVIGVGYGVHQRRVGWQHLETHEHEGAKESRTVRAGLQHADYAVGAAQTFLGEVEEEHEALLAAGLQDPGYAQVDGATLQNSFPAGHSVLSEENLKVDLNGLAVFALQDLAYYLLAVLLVQGRVRAGGGARLGGQALRAAGERTRAHP